MIKVGFPLYDLVTLAEQSSEGLDKGLASDIERLVDLTIFRTEKLGVVEASNSLTGDFINFRLEIVQKQALITEYFENAEKWISETILEQYEGKPRFVVLESTYVQSLDLYKSILNPLLSNLDLSLFGELPKIDSIDHFTDLIQSIPAGSVLLQQFNQLFKISATFDYALLTCALLFDEKLKVSAPERKILSDLLQETTEDYAVLLSLFGLWNPADEDERQLVRNVKIKLSYVESLHLGQGGKRYSIKELNQVLTA